MTIEKSGKFEMEHKFDPVHKRHYLNGTRSVLHCHHYATLYTQLAMDATRYNGIEHLMKASETVFYDELSAYFSAKCVKRMEDRVEIAQQYWQMIGMGRIRFTCIGKYEAYAEMEYSHIDEGWLKKWGESKKPVNFITTGFVAAVAALVNGGPKGSFAAQEVKSLVCGDALSEFKAVLK